MKVFKKCRWKVSLAFMVLFVLGFSIAGQALGSPPAVKEWKIPSLILMSGPWAAYGLEGKWAIDTAVEEINAAGGVRGIPLKLTWYDTAYDTAKTVQQMARVLAKKPLLILGPQGDTPQAAAGPIAAREGVFILAGNGDHLPFVNNYPWGTSLMTPIERVTKTAAEFWVDRHKRDVKSVALFTNLLSTSIQRQADVWRDVLKENGIKVYPDIEVPPDTLNFSPPVLKALGYGAEAFINIVGPDQAAKIDIELRKNKIDEGWRIVNYLATNAPPLYDIGKGYLEDTYTYDIYNPYLENARWKALLQKYRNWKNDQNTLPSYFPAYNYDLPWVIKQAFEELEITGDPKKLKQEREMIRDYILNLRNFETVLGYKINVIKKSGGAQRPLYYYQIKNNKPEILTTLQPDM